MGLNEMFLSFFFVCRVDVSDGIHTSFTCSVFV